MAPGLCLLPTLLGLAGALPGALATQGTCSQLSLVASPTAASLSGLSAPTCLGVLLPGKGVVGDAETDLPTDLTQNSQCLDAGGVWYSTPWLSSLFSA